MSGTNTVSSCTAAKYCSARNNWVQTDCPTGTTPPTGTGSSTCDLCSGSESCINGSITSTCTNPSYDWGVMCLSCPYPNYVSGSSCLLYGVGQSQSGSCANGTYSIEGDHNCKRCSPGFKCEGDKSKPTGAAEATAEEVVKQDSAVDICPARTYSEILGKMDVAECKPCLPGYNCAQVLAGDLGLRRPRD